MAELAAEVMRCLVIVGVAAAVGTVCGVIIGGAWSGKPGGINRKVAE